jgi:CubicO group peptidase (beta-lactamase class C family)
MRLVRHRDWIVAALTLPALALDAPAQQQRNPMVGFEAIAERALKEFKVPGFAIAVVKNDSLVYARGFGVRKLGAPEPVDANTNFAIGSTSKSFTAAATAMLVDEGKMRWDDPATVHLPGFQLFDPYASREIRVRDLLSHNSGLDRGEFVWYGTEYSRDDILRRVRHLKPSSSFRSRFGYQNIMYLAAGEAVAKAAGMSWDDVITRRIFQPLGMKTASTTVRGLASQTNVAQPHAEINDTIVAIPYRNIDNIAPAGSINASVTDMAQYLRFQLAGGKFGGKQLVSAGNFKAMHSPHTIVPAEPPWTIILGDSKMIAYGLGWFLSYYNGKFRVEHGGDIDGMAASAAMIPEEGLGIVVLSNLSGSLMRYALTNVVFDAFLGVKGKDHIADARKTIASMEEQGRVARANAEKARVQGTSPSLALDKFAGTYVDSMYGELVIKHEGGKLLAQRGPAFQGELEHWQHNTFRPKWKDPVMPRSTMTFVVDGQGKVSEARLDGIATFTARPAAASTRPTVTLSATDVAKFVGKYNADGLPLVVDVQIVGNDLKLTVPGQPTYTLVPVTPSRFRLTLPGAPMPEGFYLEFTADGAMLEQPAPQPTLKLKRA